VVGSAWLATAWLAPPDMRLGVLTTAAAMPASSQMGSPGSMSMSMGPDGFIATWTIMMVAMMVPSILPAVGRFDGEMNPTDRSRGAAVLFVAGYVVVWSAIGGVAYVLVRALRDWLPAGSATSLRGGGLLLILAGAYQVTPPKRACLRHCRSPRPVPVPQTLLRSPGRLAPVRVGLVQGAYCLGSSWSLMVVLLLLGMMNLIWMGVVAGVIFVEKVVPRGDAVGRLVGWGLVGVGIVLVVTPHPLPGLAGLYA
jgi:predicted metal-binding membrane protein